MKPLIWLSYVLNDGDDAVLGDTLAAALHE